MWFIQKPMPVMGRYHALPTTEVLETTAGAVAAHTTAAGAAPEVRARAAVVNMASTKPRDPSFVNGVSRRFAGTPSGGGGEAIARPRIACCGDG